MRWRLTRRCGSMATRRARRRWRGPRRRRTGTREVFRDARIVRRFGHRQSTTVTLAAASGTGTGIGKGRRTHSSMIVLFLHAWRTERHFRWSITTNSRCRCRACSSRRTTTGSTTPLRQTQMLNQLGVTMDDSLLANKQEIFGLLLCMLLCGFDAKPKSGGGAIINQRTHDVTSHLFAHQGTSHIKQHTLLAHGAVWCTILYNRVTVQ